MVCIKKQAQGKEEEGKAQKRRAKEEAKLSKEKASAM